MNEKILIALGGNALQEDGAPATAEAQLRVVEQTAAYVADILELGCDVVLAHGNGPQVGRIIQQNELAAQATPAMPFDVCGAMSQGMIGYHMQQGLARVLRARGLDRQVVTVVTQVVVDRNDPMFLNPTKPIGRFYTREEARQLQARSPGLVFKEDAGQGWRRVVPSPQPVEIVELDAVKCLVEHGFITIAVGGGGIPVVRDGDGQLRGTAAVIDKDLASEKLAEAVDADVLLILTGVEQVCIHYNQPNQEALDFLTPREAERRMAQGHFAPGSMLPKVEAALKFACSRPGRRAVITSLEKAVDALRGKAGTTICS